jgi:hypothetical protein
MKAMYSVYDRNGDCFDFCDDEGAEELISIYKRGAKDALSTNPVNFELEQTCLEVWANKQPVGGQ